MVVSNIKASYTYKKLRETSAEKALLLFGNVIQKFRKAVQMCETEMERSSQNW
jgi:hypothetical protein